MIIRLVFGYVTLVALWRTNSGQDTAAGPPPTVIVLPSTPDCQAPQLPLLILSMKKKGAGGGQTLNGVSLSDCASKCKGSPGQPTNCAGFDYNSASKTCNIYANVDQKALQDDPSSDFYQKSCIQSDNICESPMQFEMSPQKVLVGFARQVVPSPTIADCMKQCLDSYTNFGFECQSAMYYPVDQSCILNTESRYKRPDLFTDETKDQMTYFDNNCAGATCAASYVVQYTKTASIIPQNLEGIKVQSSSLSNCQAACTDNIGKPGGSGVNCKSFTFSSGDKTCTLYNDRIVPLGRANFSDGAGTDYYEKGCYKAQETCRNIPAFTRVPQKVLVGFAAFVLDGVPSVSQCLDACLKPPDSITSQNPSFKCMSVMYYYNEQECILNTETRQTKPDLMQNEVLKEDYFDIMCLGGQEMCPEGTQLTSIRLKDSKLVPVNQTNLLKQAGGSPQDCLKQCYELAPQKCRSINYAGNQCDLLMVNTDSQELTPTPGTDFYQLICLPVDSLGDCASSNPAIFDAQYRKKAGGGAPGSAQPSGTRRRKARQAADGGSSAGGGGGVSPKKTLGDQTTVSLPECLAACFKESSFGCQGVNYNIQNGLCELFDTKPSLSDNPDVDFYSNNCAAGGGTPGVVTTCNFDGMKVTVTRDQSFTGAVFAKMKYDTCRTEVKDSSTAMLQLGFPNENQGGGQRHGYQRPQTNAGAYGGSGGQQSSSYGQAAPSSGGYGGRKKRQGGYGPAPAAAATGGSSSYPAPGPQPPPPAPGYGATGVQQKTPVKAAGKVFQSPTLPPKDCGIVDFKNGTFKATIVVQANNLGIPGLVTSMDAIYEVSCDYSQFLAKKVDTNANLHVEGPTPALIQPRGKVDLSSPVTMQLTGKGGPLLQAKLGDTLELRFEMMALDSKLDFFVKECVAERGGPAPPGLSCGGPDCPGSNQGGYQQPQQPNAFGPPISAAGGYSASGVGTSSGGYGKRSKRQYGGGPPAVSPPAGYSSSASRQSQGGQNQQPVFGSPNLPGGVGGRCGPSGCFLSGGSGAKAANPNQLKLIEKGCPTPAVAQKIITAPVKRVSDTVKTVELNAFRFDGSRTVRIICQLDICRNKCNPTTCPIGGSNQESWGRKKRAFVKEPIVVAGFNHFNRRFYSDNDTFHYETDRYRVPKYSTAISSFVVVDPDEEAAAQPTNSLAQKSALDVMEEAPTIVEIESVQQQGKVCLPKVTFLTVFIFLTGLMVAQAVGVTICLALRFKRKKKL